MNDHQGLNALVLSPPPVQGIPHPSMGGSKHPFYSPKEVNRSIPVQVLQCTKRFHHPLPLFVWFWQKSEADAVLDQPVDTDGYCADDKQRTEGQHTDKQRMEGRQTDRHTEKHAERPSNQPRLDERLPEITFGETRTPGYKTESRHPERHLDKQWTVDRHTQRQIDRKMERQWMGGRQIDRSWSESRPADMQVDNQWSESRHPGRKTERQVPVLQLAQRPLPPYPSDRTPSPKQETDALKSPEAAFADWHQHQHDAQGERYAVADAVGGPTEGWRSAGGGRGGGGGVPAGRAAAPCAFKPDPPPQSSKPGLSKLRQRHRLESSDTIPGTALLSHQSFPLKSASRCARCHVRLLFQLFN